MRAPILAAVVAGTAAVAAAILTPTTAAAYPQFQLSTGAVRCNQCHFAPAGGGLINAYGRDEAGDTISARGDGSFLHGAWEPPQWIQLGLDYRGAALVNDVGNHDGAEFAAFPMQLDFYQHFRFGKQFSLTLTEGLRGSTRFTFNGPVSWLASREHYLMWRPEQQGIYVRLGRFYTPFGLRLVEHPVYVRRHIDGFDLLEEMHGLSAGWVKNEWEGHLTLSLKPSFFPAHIRSVGPDDAAITLYYERRFKDDAAVGAQARVAAGPDATRVILGAVGKWSLLDKKLLLMAELNGVHQMLSDIDEDITQLATYLGGTYFITRGLMASVIWERWDRDLSLGDVALDAFSLQAQWFFSAHFELLLLARTQQYTFGDGQGANLLMLQFHYYL